VPAGEATKKFFPSDVIGCQRWGASSGESLVIKKKKKLILKNNLKKKQKNKN